MYHFYKKINEKTEYCFNIETLKPLTDKELVVLERVLAEGFERGGINKKSYISGKSGKIIEIGPRLNFATAFSTNAVAICQGCGLKKIVRIEQSRRYSISSNTTGKDKEKFIKERCDSMIEHLYLKPLASFETGTRPEKVFTVPLIKEGVSALRKINKKMGLGMDDWDEQFYYNLFVKKFKRNPTNVECFQLGQANSEHSRHWFFNGKLIIDGKRILETLFQIVKSPLKANYQNSVIAFEDNSSAIKGYKILTIVPKKPGVSSPFKKENRRYHIIFTAETHNFPTGIAPFPGAETGGGGRIRDIEATGRGALVIAATVGYCVGNLNIPDYNLPWEDKSFLYPFNLARPLKIEIEASNGASDYGNKFGEPIIQGFTRSFGAKLPNGERQEWLKPIMFTGGVGQIDANHIKKQKPRKGMLIAQIGGPAYRIGKGGGSASSMIQGENTAELDFNAVQRGDAEMEQKMNRVIRVCSEMGKNNPIIGLHDQGAGGPCNVLTELVHPAGGKIEIRNIKLGDETLSVLEIWGTEYQERNALLIYPDRISEFQEICRREKSNCEILGKITGNGRIVVNDKKDNSTPVDLELSKIIGKMPQKTFKDNRINPILKCLKLPKGLTIKEALWNVLRLLSVGSKRFLTSKVDRSVTGLIARQQCCGPLQLPVSDVAIVAQNHFGLTGAAIAVGEQPIKMIINTKAGARMAVGEAITNIMWAKISALEHIKCSGNWMWAAKFPGEKSRIYDAANAARNLMIDLGIAIDGGKDSLSMAAKIGKEIVKSPGSLVVSAYSTVPDITKLITPDIKKPGESELWFIDLGEKKCRLGGSALTQVFNQLGNETPDIDNPTLLKRCFLAVQQIIQEDTALAGHDRSDGGLITTILEMAFSGNCGVRIFHHSPFADPISYYFNEELGCVLEIDKKKHSQFLKIIKENKLAHITSIIGETIKEPEIDIFLERSERKIMRKLHIFQNKKKIFNEDMRDLREIWEETSYQLNRLQTNPKSVDQEKKNIYSRNNPRYKISFEPKSTPQEILNRKNKPKVAIIREEGSNGDREMTSAFYLAGFEPWDIAMTDLSENKVNLDDFRGIAFVGGFSYADVFGSAKGWASAIRLSKKLNKMFDDFYGRSDTFSFGVCNGCQLMALLGWVPWRGIGDEMQPRFTKNKSGRFESRWASVKILSSPSIMLKGMKGLVWGIWVAHGEGRLLFPDKKILNSVLKKNLAAIVYTDDNGKATEEYPFNPNGSPFGITGLCSADGRHLAMMPHPERTFLKWQHGWIPEKWKKELNASPWFKMFQNAREWCEKNEPNPATPPTGERLGIRAK